MPRPLLTRSKEERLDKILDLLEKKNSPDKTGPELARIIAALRDEKEKKDREAYLAMLCFVYLSENKAKLDKQEEYENYELVFSVLGIIDRAVAARAEMGLNKDKIINSYLEVKREPFKVLGKLHKFDTGPWEEVDFTTIAGKADDDPRIKNLKEIYKQLTSKEVDPYYHNNSDEFKKMVDYIGDVVKYADTIDNMSGKKEILNEHLADAEEAAIKYIKSNGSLPDTDLGKRRQELALATILSVNKEKGAKIIDGIIADRKKILNSDELPNDIKELERIKKDVDEFTVENIAKRTKIDTTLSQDEKLERLKKDMESHLKPINNIAARTENRYIHLAEYVARRLLYDKISKMSQKASRSVNLSNADIKAGVDELLVSKDFADVYKEFRLDLDKKPELKVDVDKFYTRLGEVRIANKKKAQEEKAAENGGMEKQDKPDNPVAKKRSNPKG